MDVYSFLDVNAHADSDAYANGDVNHYTIADLDPAYEHSSTRAAAEYTTTTAA
jgi:hypothetical protein